MNAKELRLAALLVCTLAFWTTDSLHHIAPAWIGLAAAAICLTPAFGFLPARALRTINLEPAFYIAGIVSLGALTSFSGLGQHLAAWVTDFAPLSPGSPVKSFFILAGAVVMVALVTTLPAVPAVMTPMASQLAELSGLSLPAVIATQVAGFSTLLLPFQAPPLAFALQIGDIPHREAAIVSLSIGILSILLLWPLDFLWLRLLGKI